jgi:CHAD domain-containing protein
MTDAEAQQSIQTQFELSSTYGLSAATDPMIVFACACLRRGFRSLLKHQPGHGTVPSPDDIHRIRIAARRLRVALRLFKDVLPSDAADLRHELRWFGRSLGEVRDLDVYTHEFRAYREAVPVEQTHELENYERHLHRTRSDARSDLIPLFADRRYQALVHSLAMFIEGIPTEDVPQSWRSLRIADGARDHLQASARRVLKLGDKMDRNSSSRRLHRLRIKTKRLRYELEFFAQIYPSLAESAQVAKRLQDVLGKHQDACTGSARLRAYMDKHGASRGLERLLETQQRKAAGARRRFDAQWRAFKKGLSIDELRMLLAA